MCWLDDQTLVVWGWGSDVDVPLLPAALIFDADSGKQLRWFPGPNGELAFDGQSLYSFSRESGLEAWDPQDGARVLCAPHFSPIRYNPKTKQFLQLTAYELILGRIQASS